jgi:hypothetical protein
MGILPEPPFIFRQICDHQPKSGDSCLKSPFNLWPKTEENLLYQYQYWNPRLVDEENEGQLQLSKRGPK